MKQVDFDLSQPLKIGKNGQFEDCFKLILTAPSVDAVPLCRKLKQLVFSGLAKSQRPDAKESTEASPKNNEKAELTPEQFMMTVYANVTDINEFFEVFKKLCSRGAVKADGLSEGLTFHLFDQLDPDEQEKLAGEYMLNFLLGSIFQTPTKK